MEAILLYIVDNKYEILCNICKFHTFCIAFSFKLNLPYPPKPSPLYVESAKSMMTIQFLDLNASRLSWSVKLYKLKRINWHIESFLLVRTLNIM